MEWSWHRVKTILQKRWRITISGALGVFLLALAWWYREESPTIARQRLSYLCALQLKRITVALGQYADEVGGGIHLPDQLQVLVDKGYLEDARLLRCPVDDTPYYYVAGLRWDSPALMPLLVEQGQAHSNMEAGGYEYRYLVWLDREVSVYLSKRVAPVLEKCREAVQLSQENEEGHLLHRLDLERNESRWAQGWRGKRKKPLEPENLDLGKLMALWKLGQLGAVAYKPRLQKELETIESRLQRDRALEEISDFPLLLAETRLETAYAFLQMGDAAGLPIVLPELAHENFLRRQRAWRAVQGLLPQAWLPQSPGEQAQLPLSRELAKSYSEGWLRALRKENVR